MTDELATKEPEVVGTDDSASAASTTPFVLIRGEATEVEVAALTAVLSAVAAGSGTPERRPVRVWSAPERLARRALPHGPGAWRSSGLPR